MNDLTVHMIGNAHLDPVWLWHWQRGSDEALATCRAACDLLDDYPDVVFTRGEAWAYEQVRSLDPELFERIKGHVRAGRWDVVGGWWVQPDINLPTSDSILASARMGREWFARHLGLAGVSVAYNVDSFGHGAYLPRIIRDAGQSYYVMMRPDRGERALPSALFRWRSPDGAEVLTFRITGGYGANGPDMKWKIDDAVANAPAGVGHVMCFYGVGDHGGGPTRRTVEWIRAHRTYAPGVHLEFSSPTRFFAAVEGARASCPVVEGELQMHAIGCYSVCGGLKRAIRRTELALVDLERAVEGESGPWRDEARRELARAWELVCFNQFHDILPGSSIPEAVEAAADQMGAARRSIEMVAHDLLRARRSPRRTCALDGHRLHVVNLGDREHEGLAECEVWLDWQPWRHHLVDERGEVVPHQLAMPASLILERGLNEIPRVVFPARVPAGGRASFRIVEGAQVGAADAPGAPAFADGTLANDRVRVTFGADGIAGVTDVRTGSPLLAGPVALRCIDDTSDTWSHGIDRYAGEVRALASFGAPVPVEAGPLRAMVRLDGTVGDSSAQLFVGLDRGESVVRCRLATNYRERHSVLKAAVAPAPGVVGRRDRVAGGWIDRPGDGKEYPVLHALGAGGLGLVLPDTFAVSADAEALCPTLIRNSLHSLHNCCKRPFAEVPRMVERFGTDEGPQSIRFVIAFGDAADERTLERLLQPLQRPLHVWDDFRDGGRLARFG